MPASRLKRSSRTRLCFFSCLWLSIASVGARAEQPTPTPSEDDDSAALALPSVQPETTAAKPLVLITEGALTEAAQRTGGEEDAQRLSFDLRYDERLLPKLRAVFADRLDLDLAGTFASRQEINTLKEAYLSIQPNPNVLLDVGRINARQGVGVGYNPTDFFRADALRAVESLDPNSLRDERLGTVMLREETLWKTGAVTVAFAPRISDDSGILPPPAGPFNPDFAATNRQNRWLVSLSQRVAGLSPQLLAYGTDGAWPQLGGNLTAVLGSSIVAYAEASGGRIQSLWAQAQSLPDNEALRARASTGFTFSPGSKLSVTLEYEYDGAALNRADWNTAQNGNPLLYARYRAFVGAQQELATRKSAFGYASWPDLVLQHLVLSAFVRVDLIDHSYLPWSELRYHWSHIDAALRWQDFVGSATSDYGAPASRQTWQIIVDYFL